MAPMPWTACRPAGRLRVSELMSMEEVKLPGVLPDMAGLVELILARGSLTVVTIPAGSSRPRDSIFAAISEAAELEGRLMSLTGPWEKKRGEELSRVDEAKEGGGSVAEAGISNRRGGEAPVRAFLTGAWSMARPAASSCLGGRLWRRQGL